LVDKTLVLRKLSDLDTYLAQVTEYASIGLEAYKSDWKTQRIVERTLQLAVEACVDIASHIISDMACRVPTTYADTFRVLEENGILDSGLCESLVNMCKFRNIIVHEYDKVDPGIVVNILKNRLVDFERYRERILGFLRHPE